MYRPPAFREDRPEVLHQLIRSHPLGTLVTYGVSGLTANLVPFSLAEGAPDVLRAHLAKANEQVSDLRDGADAMVIFQGPEAYVSPSWYPTKREHGKVVPTWNYIIVQAWGRPRLVDDEGWLRDQLAKLTMEQEKGRIEPWVIEDAPPSFISAQVRGIVGLEIPIDRIEGKWKASQNQPPANRAGVLTGLRELEPASAMAAIMSELE